MSAARRWHDPLHAIGWDATVFILLGVAFLALGASDLARLLEARGWPTAPARIVRSEIRAATDAGGDTVYHLSVAYTYTYAGRRYTSERVSFGDSFDEGTRHDPAHTRVSRFTSVLTGGGTPVYGDASRAVVEFHARAFAVGTSVTAHVNPANPAIAVIDVEPTWYNTRAILRAFVMFAIAAVLYGVRRWRSGAARVQP